MRHIYQLELTTVEYVGDVFVINVRPIDHPELTTVEYIDVYVKWTTIVHGKCLL